MPPIFDQANYAFRAFVALPLVPATLVLLLGIAVTLRERGSRISLLFLAMTSSVAMWLFAFSLMYATANPRIAFFCVRIADFDHDAGRLGREDACMDKRRYSEKSSQVCLLKITREQHPPSGSPKT